VKITIDKITSEPKHSISKHDIQIVLSKIPFDYQETIVNFKISAQLFENSKWDRPVIYNNTTFNILSRGITRKEIIKELLVEIFLQKNISAFPTYGHQLNSVQRKKMEEIIHPYLNEIIQQIDFNDKHITEH
jgi:hypothetical protein